MEVLDVELGNVRHPDNLLGTTDMVLALTVTVNGVAYWQVFETFPLDRDLDSPQFGRYRWIAKMSELVLSSGQPIFFDIYARALTPCRLEIAKRDF